MKSRVTDILNRLKRLEQPAEFRVQHQNSVVKFEPNIWQANLLKRPGLSLVLKSRQIGITSLGVIRAIDNVFKGGKSVIACPSDTFAYDVLAKVEVAIGHLYEVTMANKRISFGKYFISLSNSNYEALRGLNANFVYVTEAGLITQFSKAMEALIPLTTTYDSWQVWVDGTVPKSANEFIAAFDTWLIEEAKVAGWAARGDLVVACNPSKTAKGREFGLTLPSFKNAIKVTSVPLDELFEGRLYSVNGCLLEWGEGRIRVISADWRYNNQEAKRRDITRISGRGASPIVNSVEIEEWEGESFLITTTSSYSEVENAITCLLCNVN